MYKIKYIGLQMKPIMLKHSYQNIYKNKFVMYVLLYQRIK
jgi:hypothetical protein